MIGVVFKGALAAFGAAGLVTKLITVGVLLASLAAAYGVWHHRIYQRGVDDTLAGVARADAKLVNRALQMRSVLNDCKAAGRGWDQSTGRCK